MDTPKLTELLEQIARKSFSSGYGMTTEAERVVRELSPDRVIDLFAELKLADYELEWAIIIRMLPRDRFSVAELMRATVHYALDHECLKMVGHERDRQTGRLIPVQESATA